MEGTTLQYGACTNVSNIQNPISLARVLCERQSKLLTLDRIPPMVLSGDGASKYAKEMNLTLVEPKQLISRKAAKCYEHYRNNVEQYENIYNIKITPMDTVGAICVDLDGNCVAGCSSGGLILKISGRVGQAATYGAGCWAVSKPDSVAATCTTGNGEYLMKTLLAKEIVDDLLQCECPVTSLHNTFKNKFIESPFLSQLREVYGGALSIVYDPRNGDGELLWSHTTQSLCLGYMSTLQKNPKVSLRLFLQFKTNFFKILSLLVYIVITSQLHSARYVRRCKWAEISLTSSCLIWSFFLRIYFYFLCD